MEGKAKTGKIELDHLQVTCGDSLTPTATVHLKMGDEVKKASAIGNGPFNAACMSIPEPEVEAVKA